MLVLAREPIKPRFAIRPEQMAESYVRLGLSPEFKGVTGKYFDENCVEVKSSGRSYDRAVWAQLRQVSARLTHLDASVRDASQPARVPVAI